MKVQPLTPADIGDIVRAARKAAGLRQARRIHQEDFCQALAVNPERKYAGEGGPTFSDCFALLRRVCSRPAVVGRAERCARTVRPRLI